MPDPLTMMVLGCVVLALGGRAAGQALARQRDLQGSSAWRRSHPQWPAAPLSPPIERLSADLRRLQATCAEIERADPPMKAARLLAASMAYDDVLLQACRALEVEVGEVRHRPLRPVERLQTEAELARAGLRW